MSTVAEFGDMGRNLLLWSVLAGIFFVLVSVVSYYNLIG
jgi:hypothetical protein